MEKQVLMWPKLQKRRRKDGLEREQKGVNRSDRSGHGRRLVIAEQCLRAGVFFGLLYWLAARPKATFLETYSGELL